MEGEMFHLLEVFLLLPWVQALKCKEKVICKGYEFCCHEGSSCCNLLHVYNLWCYEFCCHEGSSCCNLLHVYNLWWFWFLLVIILFLIIGCILALRRSRSAKRHYARIDPPVNGGLIEQPATLRYNPPPYVPDQRPPYQ